MQDKRNKAELVQMFFGGEAAGVPRTISQIDYGVNIAFAAWHKTEHGSDLPEKEIQHLEIVQGQEKVIYMVHF